MGAVAIIDYRTTHWAFKSHPEVTAVSVAEVLRYHKAGNEIKSVQLFPEDLVVVAIGNGNQARLLHTHPTHLELYKHFWDISGAADQKTLRRHLKRCPDIRLQIRDNLVSADVMTWYMALVLGGPTG